MIAAVLCAAMVVCARDGSAQALSGTRFTARVLANHDGDTFTTADRDGRRTTVRLYGIDAPEIRQDAGAAAKQFLASLILGKQIDVYPGTFERSGRLVARVMIDATDVSVAVLRAGYGWHSTEFSRDPLLADAERTARLARRGLWADQDPVPPWVFRRSGRKAVTTAPSSGPFHGNVRSFVYHAQGCPDYACRTCTRDFTTTAAADAAGFRAHASCVLRRPASAPTTRD
jgi:endonuclease YncB( thermonuclease family)